jgi:hypothetical protein
MPNHASSRAAARWQWAVLLIVGAYLFAAGWGLNPAIEADVFGGEAPTVARVRSLAGSGRLYLPAGDEEQLKFDRFFRFDSFYPSGGWSSVRATLLPNLFMLDRIPSVNNFDPLVPGRYERWMEALEEVDASTRERMLNLMAVGVVEKVDGSQASGIHFEGHPGQPRLRWASCGRLVPDGATALELVVHDADLPREAVILEPAEARAPFAGAPLACAESSPGERGAGEPASLRITGESPNRLEIHARAPDTGYLILADMWYPGWRATVDGKPAPVLHADYLFRAVPVPAGEHAILFTFRPVSFYWGLVASCLAWTALVAAFFGRTRKKPPGRTRRTQKILR